MTQVQVDQRNRGRHGTLITRLKFTTLSGHLLAGEERFGVEWNKGGDDSVWLDLWSASRGSGILGRIAFPFIIPIQKAFFRQLSKGAAD